MVQKEPKIEILETGSIPENELPEGANVIQTQRTETKTVKQVLAEDVLFLRGLSFNTDEVEKFGMIIAKVKQDLVACVEALDKAEKEAKKNGNSDAE